MRSVFIPPEILSMPEDMEGPVVKHYRLDLRRLERHDRSHLSTAYPEMRQQAPSATSSSSLFAPRLVRTKKVREKLNEVPEAILAIEKSKLKK